MSDIRAVRGPKSAACTGRKLHTTNPTKLSSTSGVRVVVVAEATTGAIPEDRNFAFGANLLGDQKGSGPIRLQLSALRVSWSMHFYLHPNTTCHGTSFQCATRAW